MNSIAKINGLEDSSSILEKNKCYQPALRSDILYNDKEPFDLDLQGLYYDEGFIVSDYRVEDFGESVNLLSTSTTNENLFNLDLRSLHYDEGFPVSEHRVEDFGESITLLSTITMKEALVGSDDTL